jgi:hypothetical protein
MNVRFAGGLALCLLAGACGVSLPPAAGPEEAFPGRAGVLHRALLLAADPPVLVSVEEVDGQFVLDGDILVDRSELRLLSADESPLGIGRSELATVVGSKKWPGALVPYRIDPALTDVQRVDDALAHWEANTVVRFVPRTSQQDYVTFRPSTGCSATVGRKGGEQFVNLAISCSTGNTMHEVGHALGLYHEQSRADRDGYVLVHWANITAGKEHNFQTYVERNLSGADVGPYDLGSLMHYGSSAFSSNGSPTLTRLDGTTFTAQRKGLSVADVDGVGQLYGYPDTTPPTVAITSPSSGDTLRGEVTVTATAMDDKAVERVEIWRPGKLLASLSSPPWSVVWNTATVPDGQYALTANAFDAAGNQGKSFGVGVKVHNVDLAPPSVELVEPVALARVQGEVLLVASAADDFGVTQLEFFADDVPLGLLAWPASTLAWDSTAVPNGPVGLRVRALDAAGHAGTSQTVLVQVDNPDIVAPRVTLVPSAAGEVLSGVVILSAEASDEVGVTAVSFHGGDTELGVLPGPPWQLSWDTRTVPNGPIELHARALDAAGNQGRSGALAVRVENRAAPEAPAAGRGCTSAPLGLPLWMGLFLLLPLGRGACARRMRVRK